MSQFSACWNRLKILGFLMAIVGWGIFFLVEFSMKNGQRIGDSYFFGTMTGLCLTLGCLGLAILQHTVKARWGLPVIRMFEAGGSVRNLILMGVLFFPIALFKGGLYPWCDKKLAETEPILMHKAAYLNSTSFDIRTAFYFALWIILAFLLRRSSCLQDTTKDPKEESKRTNIASPGILLFVLSINFAMTDWVMSLDYKWFSSIFGIWMMIGMVLMAMAFANMLIGWFAYQSPYKEVINPALTRDLGNMLFVFTMFWGYTTLSQFIIIWHGNLPEYISYYYHRNQGFWQSLGAINIIGQFFCPFFLLLIPLVKRVPKYLMMVGLWVFLFRFSDLFWQIIPMFRKTGLQVSDVAAVFGVMGVWLVSFVTEIKKANLLPQYDPRLFETSSHH